MYITTLNHYSLIKNKKINTTNRFRKHLLMELTLGTFSAVQMPSCTSLSRISQANIVGLSSLYRMMESTTGAVATFGFEPPMTPGRVEPVS